MTGIAGPGARRVVVTGVGAVTPLGPDAASLWAGLRAGRSALGPLTTIQTEGLKVAVGGEIRDFDPDARLDRRTVGLMDRFAQLAVAAAREAADAAGLPLDDEARLRTGAIVGTGNGGFGATEEGYRRLFVEKANRVHAFTVPRVMPSAAASQVSMALGLQGPSFGTTSACASANHAIGLGMQFVRAGIADAMVVGGAEAPIGWGVFKAWEALRVLAPDTCRPFSKDRAGLVLAEGAAAVVLEPLDRAVARGAPILAEIAGFGTSADAGDLVAPTLDGPVRAMRAALADAGMAPEDVDYVNAHGSGTPMNDATETRAIKEVFGRHAHALSVSSTKSMHGHALGATGAVELIACVRALAEGIVPPTANYREPDPECDLDVTPNEARSRPLRAAVSNAFAFGGLNAVLVVRGAPAGA